MAEGIRDQLDKKVQFISINRAGEALGVDRTTVYNYVRRLQIEMHKFPLDRKSYIAITDLERIKAAKNAALEGIR